MDDSHDAALQVVQTYMTRLEAELACSALRAAGIDAIVSGDDAGGNRPDLARRGVQVMVRAEDAASALAIVGAQE